MGKRSRFSAKRAAVVLRALRRGKSRKAAARAAGVTANTLDYWIERGLAGLAPFVRFAREAERVRGEAIERELWSRAETLFARLKQGWSLSRARQDAGIHPVRWQRWLKVGAAGTRPFAEFVRQLRGVQASTQPCRKLSPARTRRLIGLVGQGLRHWEAAARAGIGKNTLVQWLKWGRAGRQPYVELAAGIEAAEENVQRCRVLTPGRVKKLLAALVRGKSGEAACRAAGLCPETFRKCLKAGRAGKAPLAAFAARVQAARRVAEGRRRRGAWQRLRRESWETAARRLTRRDPDNWSLRRVRARTLAECEW